LIKAHNLDNGNSRQLVSIIVLTYNSSKFITEALDSIRDQTYKDIELIISDDCSIDNTVDLCRLWLQSNKEYFVRAEILQVDKNTGIPANCNRGVKAAKGNWVKMLAGDDLLVSSCIEDNIKFMYRSDYKFIFSNVEIFNEWNDYNVNIERQNSKKKHSNFYKLNAREQFLHLLLKGNPMFAPSMFFNRDVLLKIGGFDEKSTNEDSPLYLLATKSGYKLGYFEKVTVKYRVHRQSHREKYRSDEAISYWTKKKLRTTVKPYITWSLFFTNPLIVLEYWNLYWFNELIIVLGNKKEIKNKLLIIRFFSPLFSVNYLRKKFNHL
jgi:glycosyltransferase involved in cell wall biosynthesis